MIPSWLKTSKRCWLDGPKWVWLCGVIGHQRNWRHWYINAADELGAGIANALGWSFSGPTPSWHYHGTHSMEGMLCGRCGEVIKAGTK